jgi:hypothetical protein
MERNKNIKKNFLLRNDSKKSTSSQIHEKINTQRAGAQGARAQHNPNNLFGQLLRLGRDIGIPENILIDYLKFYTTQPGIVDIAENPTKPDVEFCYEEMIREISPGMIKFRQVLEQGISVESMGSDDFKRFMQHNPPVGYIWAFERCPNLISIQQEICISQSNDMSDLCCFIEGFMYNPNGSISFFKQRNISNFKHIFNKSAFIWLANVGSFIIHGYTGTNPNILINEERKENPFYGIPSRIDQISVYHDRRILANQNYHAHCQNAMTKIGGIPISFNCQEQETSEVAQSSSEIHVEESTRRCKHDIWGGGEVLGRCEKCDWGN